MTVLQCLLGKNLDGDNLLYRYQDQLSDEQLDKLKELVIFLRTYPYTEEYGNRGLYILAHHLNTLSRISQLEWIQRAITTISYNKNGMPEGYNHPTDSRINQIIYNKLNEITNYQRICS